MESGSKQPQDTFELPKPAHTTESPSHDTGERVFKDAELQTAPQDNGASPPIKDNSILTNASDTAQTAQVQAAPISQVPPQIHQGDQHLAADDVDLIEKEWVDKAKAIVEQTKNDPYLQNKEMSKVKAKYIENRWRKKIKLADDLPQT